MMVDKGVICNGDMVVLPETQRKLLIKSVYDSLHDGITATKKVKARSMLTGIFTWIVHISVEGDFSLYWPNYFQNGLK